MSEPPTRVVVVDDHELVRAGLRGVLASDPAIDVVAEASDGTQALAAVEIHHPDVVVMDLQMPSMGGVEATQRILAARPGTAVLVLTMFDDDDSIFAAIRAGARGYLLKGARRDELRAAVVGVSAGQVVFGAGVAARVLDRMTERPDPDVVFPELTPREREVLGHLVDGQQPEAIAPRMAIAEKTVRNNISSLLTKLHVSDRASAIERARKAGMGQSRPTTEVRTLMFTEIADSTPLVRRLGDAYATVLADHNHIVRTAVEAHGGTRYALAGDAHAAWFRDPSAAIASAIDAHRKLSSHAFATGAEVRIRVGIHRGAVTTHGEELVGVALHEVARVASTAVGGETLITDEGMPGDLAPNLRLVDLGERELRDFDRPIRLFRAEFLP